MKTIEILMIACFKIQLPNKGSSSTKQFSFFIISIVIQMLRPTLCGKATINYSFDSLHKLFYSSH
jgi:hypothetical protein